MEEIEIMGDSGEIEEYKKGRRNGCITEGERGVGERGGVRVCWRDRGEDAGGKGSGENISGKDTSGGERSVENLA